MKNCPWKISERNRLTSNINRNIWFDGWLTKCVCGDSNDRRMESNNSRWFLLWCKARESDDTQTTPCPHSIWFVRSQRKYEEQSSLLRLLCLNFIRNRIHRACCVLPHWLHCPARTSTRFYRSNGHSAKHKWLAEEKRMKNSFSR